jgi:hypothetical protein
MGNGFDSFCEKRVSRALFHHLWLAGTRAKKNDMKPIIHLTCHNVACNMATKVG